MLAAAALTSFLGGSAFRTLLDNRARRKLIASQANKNEVDALSVTITGAAGALIKELKAEVNRQGQKIVRLETRLEERSREVLQLREENHVLHVENEELQTTVRDLTARVTALEER